MLAARPSSRPSSAAPKQRWHSAGDALVAAQRLRTQQPAATLAVAPPRGMVTLAEPPSPLPLSAVGLPERRAQPLVAASQNALAGPLAGPGSAYRIAGIGYGSKLRLAPPPTSSQLASPSYHEAEAAKRKAAYGAAALTAARDGDPGQLRKLLDDEPSAALWQDECQVTPLMMASAYGRGACVDMLLGAGARVDRVNQWGSTPLINAAHNAKVGVVKALLIHEASAGIKDKDGTAFDNALGRLHSMLGELAASTDPTHPDKPGLVAAAKKIAAVVDPKGRPAQADAILAEGIATMRVVLERAFALLAAAEADDDEEEGGAGGEKPDGEPPSAGVAALYRGCEAYAKIIVMLQDPAKVRKEAAPGGKLVVAEGGRQDGLTQRVGRIRTALALDVGLALPEHVAQANQAMGFEPSGSLPDQVARLVAALGIE